ncbi:MAG: hypothetical protein J6Q84_07500 [Kiritimatiellae bacterium]|nr:hypothetical protein [Kiritimatiellia bacterium]
MKYLYEYRTSDNVIHDGVINARTREEAFSKLKRDGIRPSRLREAPGIFNKLWGKGKRWIAIFVLAVLSLFFLIKNAQRSTGDFGGPDDGGVDSELDKEVVEPTMRRQVWGDAAIIEKGCRTGWEFVFSDMGDRFLASFAIPGVEPAVKNVEERLLYSAIQRDVDIMEEDGFEVRQIKSMLRGMKKEALAYIKEGGSLSSYVSRLIERQEFEIKMLVRVKGELKALEKTDISREELEELWEKRNEELRMMGIQSVSFPEAE